MISFDLKPPHVAEHLFAETYYLSLHHHHYFPLIYWKWIMQQQTCYLVKVCKTFRKSASSLLKHCVLQVANMNKNKVAHTTLRQVSNKKHPAMRPDMSRNEHNQRHGDLVSVTKRHY